VNNNKVRPICPETPNFNSVGGSAVATMDRGAFAVELAPLNKRIIIRFADRNYLHWFAGSCMSAPCGNRQLFKRSSHQTVSDCTLRQ